SIRRGTKTIEISIGYLRPWTRHMLTEEDTQLLLKPVMADEVKQPVFGIADDKASEPAGYSSGF
ncbi:UNVERIFIED_CONTAM: hypothetical protein Sindi_0963300, partial [Sesamum indicum]